MVKSGTKSSEFVVLIASIAAAVVPVVLGQVPPDSVASMILGALGASAAYIAGRSYVKGKAATAGGDAKPAKAPRS